MLSSLALSIHNHPFLGGYGMALTSYAQRISFLPKLEVVPPPDFLGARQHTGILAVPGGFHLKRFMLFKGLFCIKFPAF